MNRILYIFLCAMFSFATSYSMQMGQDKTSILNLVKLARGGFLDQAVDRLLGWRLPEEQQEYLLSILSTLPDIDDDAEPQREEIIRILNEDKVESKPPVIRTVARSQNAWLKSAVFDADGKDLIVTSQKGDSELFDANRGTLLRTFSPPVGYTLLALSSDFTKTLVRNIVDYSDVYNRRTFGYICSNHQMTLLNGPFVGNASAFSPNGELLLEPIGSNIQLWNTSHGELIGTLEGHQSGILNADFDKSGNKVISSSMDNTAKIWDLTSSSVITLSGHKDWVRKTILSDEYQLIFTGSHDKTAKIWDFFGACIHTLGGHEGPVLDIAINWNMHLLATASRDTVKIWDAQTGEFLYDVKHEFSVLTVSFNAEGTKLVTTSQQNNVLTVWDLPYVNRNKGKILSKL